LIKNNFEKLKIENEEENDLFIFFKTVEFGEDKYLIMKMIKKGNIPIFKIETNFHTLLLV
jgi:hypothetical protein